MSILVFGKGDNLYLFKVGIHPAPGEATTTYTHPSLNVFYSPHGFHYPLDHEQVRYASHADNTIVNRGEHLGTKLFDSSHKYLEVTENGLVNLVNINGAGISFSEIYVTEKSWWLHCNVSDDKFYCLLKGFLRTNPTDKQIRDITFKYTSNELEKLSIKEISRKVREEFTSIHFSVVLDKE